MQFKGYSDSFIEELKQRSSIVSVISKYITLNKKGKTYWACCPFHYEKTPSFAVNESEQFYHCFGCGKSGSVIKFVQEYEHVNFVEAVKILANDIGMKLPEMENNSKELEQMKLKADCMKATNLAMEYYKSCLNNANINKIAQEYIKKRQFDDDIIKKFNIGYSYNAGGLVNFLKQNKIDPKVSKQAGLINTTEDNVTYDCFARRLIFPITNTYGDPVGFTGRLLEDNPNYAKYKNSSQTLIFDKSRIVYNLNMVRELSKSEKVTNVIICEGTVDVIAMYRAGFKNAVACMGTAITSFHAREIKRFCEKVLLCLDGDSAGQNAMYKAVDVFLEQGFDVKIIKLKDNLDPDEFLKIYGKEALKEALNKPIDCIEYKLISKKNMFNLDDNFQKNRFVLEALEIIKNLDSNSEREIYLKFLSKLVNLSIDILRRDLVLKLSNSVPTENLGAKNLTSQNTQNNKNMPNSQNSRNSQNAGIDKNTPNISNKNEENESLPSRADGHLKAIKFILASFVHKKDYAKNLVTKNITFQNKNYQDLFNFVKTCLETNKPYTISTLFDVFDTDENADIKEIIDFDFLENLNEEEYFKQCLDGYLAVELMEQKDSLTKEFKEEKDLNKRRLIAEKLNLVTKQIIELKNKRN